MTPSLRRLLFSACFAMAACLVHHPTAPAAVEFRVEATPAGIEASTDNWTLEVAADPLRLTLRRGGRTIARTSEGRGAVMLVDGARIEYGRLVDWRSAPDCLWLTLAADEMNRRARMTIVPFEDHLGVRVYLEDEQVCLRIEQVWELEAGGHWYGGNVTSAHNWPLETAELELDPFLATSNQTTPVWLASSGAAVFAPTYGEMGFAVNREGDGMLRVFFNNTPHMEYKLIAGEDIVAAYDTFTMLAGRPRTVPPRGYFDKPIFNTWIEFRTAVNQQGVLEYANTLRSEGFGCDVFMIDDKWQSHYGDHTFDTNKFPDAGAMVDTMHAMGFKVILWVVPFVDFDADSYSYLEARNWLVREPPGDEPAAIEWWNGTSALVDLSNPDAFAWYVEQLKSLQRRYGIDGFKLDAGDAEYFSPRFLTYGNVSPNRYTDLFAEAGTWFLINEYRVSWLAQPMGLVQRLRDKNNNWSRESGLGSLIPHGMCESLIGYPYFCPDIIGGGLAGDFMDERFKGMDPELFVRWTQASCLMPMMQFSYAPWHLDDRSVEICLRYAELHEEFGDYIYRLARQAPITGRPIAAPLFFLDPRDERTYTIDDQFVLGDSVLVAPVLEPGARERNIYLPKGEWRDYHSGEVHRGPKMLTGYPAPLKVLPVFTRQR